MKQGIRIIQTLKRLKNDETLLVQSGKPVAVFKSHADAPRVLLANSNLLPHWATWEHFDELAAKGLMMYGQMTAGSWIYIGTQGILQGTYETFGALAKLKGWGSLKGKFCLTAGLGGMGGAQPLAITMNEGVGLIVEVDPERAKRRQEIGFVDMVVDNLEEAMTLVEEAVEGQVLIGSLNPGLQDIQICLIHQRRGTGKQIVAIGGANEYFVATPPVGRSNLHQWQTCIFDGQYLLAVPAYFLRCILQEIFQAKGYPQTDNGFFAKTSLPQQTFCFSLFLLNQFVLGQWIVQPPEQGLAGLIIQRIHQGFLP